MAGQELSFYMLTNIKDKDSAEDIGITLSFISMYAEYLDGKQWEGPKLNYDRVKYKKGIRKLFKLNETDFTDSYLLWNNSDELKGIKPHLEKLDNKELVNELMTLYTYIMNNQ